jgi:hypothetical protein
MSSTLQFRETPGDRKLTPFPESAKVEVPQTLASDLWKAAERLPHYANQEFYSTELQRHIRDHIQELCPDGLLSLVGQIGERLARWPYCTLVSGLRFDQGNRLFVGLNRCFGELVARPYEEPRAQLVHYIQPATDIPSARGGRESERLHTDTADWETPVELISMLCVRADPGGGGRSRVLDVDSVRDEIQNHLGTAALAKLETELVPWQLAPYCGGGLKWRTVLNQSSMCWRRYTINLALESNDLKLGDEMLTLLDSFEAVVSSSPQTVDFLMREGEILFSDNHRTIHARTPISNANSSDRLMIRSWIKSEME